MTVIMKVKKAAAAILAAVMTLSVFLAPASELSVRAEYDPSVNHNEASVYTLRNKGVVPEVAIRTPAKTVKLYAGLTWEQLEMDMGVRLNVSNSGYGPVAQASVRKLAASLNANVMLALDMDMEKYKGGWAQKIEEAMLGPVQVCITLPEGYDLSKDYAVISIRENGKLEVLGDLDWAPETLTVDSTYFDTFVIISGNQGAFDAYKIGHPEAVEVKWVPERIKQVGSTIKKNSNSGDLYTMGVSTVHDTAIAVIGDWNPVIMLSKHAPGLNAVSSMQYVVNKNGLHCTEYHEVYLTRANGDRIRSTSVPLHINVSIPWTYPAYADYAVLVLDENGGLSIARDVIPEDGMITIATNQFNAYGILWGPKGSFDNY